MSLGEWISVKSSQGTLRTTDGVGNGRDPANPEGEKKELALIYMAKGIPDEQARAMAEKRCGIRRTRTRCWSRKNWDQRGGTERFGDGSCPQFLPALCHRRHHSGVTLFFSPVRVRSC